MQIKETDIDLEKHRHKLQQFRLLTPLLGTLLYLLLYYVATRYYPGGSQFDINSKGFSWAQNYWCNLLNENALNGMQNPAKPIALTAMLVLSVTLIIFWYIFPQKVSFKSRARLLIQLSGILSMAFSMLLFTSLHNIVINIATFFGLIAITGTYIGLKKLKWMKLFWMGIFIIPIIGLNNFLYYKEGMLFYLPVVQKITFLYFLIWMCLIDINLFKKFNLKQKSPLN